MNGKAVSAAIIALALSACASTPDANYSAYIEANARAQQAWDGLSHTRRKELARSIDEAKRPETRARRLAAALGELLGTA